MNEFHSPYTHAKVFQFVFFFIYFLFSLSLFIFKNEKYLKGTTPAGPVFKHKLFLTDGWTCAFTGVCIYIFRINTTKQLPEEGFQKDL